MFGFFGGSGSTGVNKGPPDVRVQVLNEKPPNYTFTEINNSRVMPGGAWNQLRDKIRDDMPYAVSRFFDIGILKDTLAPSLALHSSLSIAAWAAGGYTGYVEAKDWLWPTGMVMNAWWSAVGRKLATGVPISMAFKTLSWPERLLLTGVTLWGGRLFDRVASRTIKRGKDDPRYDGLKEDKGFWKKALLTTFFPEALFQTIIALPFTAPFRHDGAVLTGYHPYIQMFAVGLFSAGFALEILADHQLNAHKEDKRPGLMRDGVWSIVRHPNYLGDTLCHLSFPILLYGSDMLAPIELLGPLANYVFLRYVSGDKENEAGQAEHYARDDPTKKDEMDAYRNEKNSFWPSVQEIKNEWTWIVIGCGAVGVAIDQGFRMLHHA